MLFSKGIPMSVLRSVSLTSVILSTTALGCVSTEKESVNREELAVISALPNRNLDVLFVIDNSGSMGDEQELLARNFPRFMEKLQSIPGGLPNVHIGVTTTDMGTLGGPAVGGCQSIGDQGGLQLNGAETTDQHNFLIDIDKEDVIGSNDRFRNYQGDLAVAFASMAHVGTNGCGFEQPLAAMKASLTSADSSNRAFLRPDANLAVVIVTDEDDCSATGPNFFGTTPALGQMDSFRCFSQGVICDNDDADPQRIGDRLNCRPRTDSQYQSNVQTYIESLIAIKGDERKVMVAGVIAPSSDTPLHVIQNPYHAAVVLEAGCAISRNDTTSEAAPAVRLQAFLKGFPGRAQQASICDDHFDSVLSNIGSSTARLVDGSCLSQKPALADDGALDCVVSEQVARISAGHYHEVALPSCTDAASTDCYRIATDAQSCGSAADGLRLTISRSAGTVSNYAVARCKVAQHVSQ
jgi:hypothetical protein